MFRLSFLLCSKVQFSTGNVKNLLKDSQLIDFLKIIVRDLNPSILEKNPLLNFFDNINLSTGEIKTTNRAGRQITPFKNAFYNGLEFKIYESGLITISGSLHKFWNAGAHNYNDFNYNAILCVINELSQKFNINREQCILKCLELGINLIPPIATNQFLDYCFLHKTKSFEYQKNSDEGKYKQVQHSQYIIKIYNKALHYKSRGFDIDTEIMRFEIKYNKMQKLNERGIFTLKDLIDYGLLNFKDELLNEFNNILFYDTTIKAKNSSIAKYRNQLYWTELLDNKRNDLFNYHRKNLKKITATSSEQIQLKTAEILSKKIDSLNCNTTQIDPLIILSNRVVTNSGITSKNVLCVITNINISMQRDKSILLSHTGLQYYYKTDKKMFEQLRRKYLTKKWYNADHKTQIKEIAHQIRTCRNNQKIRQRKIYKENQLNMLPTLEI